MEEFPGRDQLKLLAALHRRQARYKAVHAATFFLIAFVAAPPSHARVTRVVVESRAPQHDLHEGKIAYERIQGVIYGEVDPRDRRNAIIQDIALAPRNDHGMVEYAATFTLLKPIKLSESNGTLLYEVVNRGASIVPKDLAGGDIFLSSGWQGDLAFRGKSAYGTAAETIQLPIAKNADGSSITGPALLRFSNIKDGASSVPTHQAASYVSSGAPPLPVDLDTAHATLTSRTFETVTGVAGGERTIPASDWSWGDCSKTPFPGQPDPQFVCLRQGFEANQLYQLVYQAKDPIVLGLGLAAVRDVASFFHHAAKDDAAWENPVAGAISHTIVQGASQSGNLIRTLLNLGFNEDESGRRVFDGAMPTIAARQTPINLRFAVPGGASSLFEPGSDGTVWWAHSPDAVRHQKPSGLLDRCTATHTCPLIVEVLSSTEFWTLRASPDFVGTDNAKDIPLPANVRRYYVASTQHGGGPGGFHSKLPTPEIQRGPFAATCVLPPNPNPMREIQSALLVALKGWVANDSLPPPSVYPTLASGALVPANAEAMGFPAVPGLPRPDSIANPLLVYGFGSSFEYPDEKGAIKQQPPIVEGVIPPRVPRVDADGNEVGGIHTVLQQAALGTYLGWNVIAQGFFKGQYCSLNGSYLPFAQTKDEREAAHDSRLSLEERYGSHAGYVCAVKHAAGNLVRQRFLLQDDADRMINEAQSSDILLSLGKTNPADEAVAARQCSRQP
jgi:hypothetical protein